MKVTQEVSSASTGAGSGEASNAELVLAFAAPALLRDPDVWRRLRASHPRARILAGSTAGEIADTRVLDDSVVTTAIQFESTRVRCASVDIESVESSALAGERLALELAAPDLRHVFVLSEGLKVNGSELVRGLTSKLPAGVALTGGLCGDGARFERTHVCLDEFRDGARIAAVGFYGDSLRVGLGSLGGWDTFGPERMITRSVGNVLYELDGRPALDLYEQYLGDHAADLPASGLLFPLTVRARLDEPGVVRTILAIDREAHSLTFAGDVPQGQHASLMRANFDRLVEGAEGAARTCHQAVGSSDAELALLISCVGRKLVLKQRVEEELESVRGVLGPAPVLTGFYSYGEISPFTPSARCELHNQTMTITTLSEH